MAMDLLEKFKNITTFVFDIDGVLTDSSVLLFENGLQARRMNIKDGLGLQMAMKNNYRVVVLSGAYSQPVVDRMHYLGITEVFTAIKNKKEFLLRFISDNEINISEVLFMGDDLPDIELLGIAGVSCCPADAVNEVRSICDFISPIKGGEGCVRDVIEKVLKLRDDWKFDTAVTSR